MPKKLQKGLEVRHFPGSVGEVLWGSEIVSKGVCRKGLVELSQGGHFPASVQEVLLGPGTVSRGVCRKGLVAFS